MTIPGRGDLSPRRKHRNWRRRLSVGFVVLVLGAGGYVGYRLVSGGSEASLTALPPCPATTPTQAPAQQARLTVRNATLTEGLATEVARQLRQRNFHVGKVGNTLFRGKGVATVQYSTDRLQAARLVAAQFDGATLLQVDGARVLEVDIGPKYRKLVPVAQAEVAARAILATLTPTPSTTSSPTCAPRSVTTTP